MTWIELLSGVGNENLIVQSLVDNLTGAQIRKNGQTELKFMTDVINPSDVMANRGRIGMVIWIDRADWQRVTAERDRLVLADQEPTK